jgi:hypothetical protein
MSLPTGLPDAARMKVHLRLLRLAGRTFRVVSLRPTDRARFSTNYYHDTWHVVSDTSGAAVLARLLWGLAFQKQPGTLVLLSEPHLVPTPFDGAKSDPVVVIPAGLTPTCDDALRELKSRLGRLGPPTQTIRWHTFGLDREVAAWQAERDKPLHEWTRPAWSPTDLREPIWHSEQMGKRGGLICYVAPPLVLRDQAVMVARMRTGPQRYAQMDYHYLAQGDHARSYADGEVQIFHDYRARVSAATAARREVLSRPDAPTDPDTLETVVSARRDAIRRQRRRRTQAASS